jgi:AcrR family transcriptional regulator
MAGARRKNRTQPNLTAERVRDEALRLIEAEGLEEFSTRKLGRALGVEAMAIYWYYPSKEALLDAVSEAMVSRIGPPAKAPIDFIDALRKLAHAYRGLAHEYPNAFPLLAMRRFGTEGAYGFLEGLFTMAQGFGLDDRSTARWYRLVSTYCSGVALDELAGLKELDEKENVEEGRNAFPHVKKVFAWLGPDHYDDVFSFGLEVLLDSIASAAKNGKTAKAKPAKTKSTRKGSA